MRRLQGGAGLATAFKLAVAAQTDEKTLAIVEQWIEQARTVAAAIHHPYPTPPNGLGHKPRRRPELSRFSVLICGMGSPSERTTSDNNTDCLDVIP